MIKKKKRPSRLTQKPPRQFLLPEYNPMARPLWMCVLLAFITLAVYWPVVGFDFVNYDDPDFVGANPHVLGGLTWENFRWAFGTGWAGNWMPLTWLSYMLDVDWSGTTAAGMHLTNILLHATNTVLTFLLFRRLTGAHWRSAVLAGLFGLHPLHVESVAWVAERKDILSTLFWLLAIWMYARFAQKPVAGFPRWSNEYVLALIFFAFGLMCKPMVVTLPFVLLLLDYWPLRRIDPADVFTHRAKLARLLGEKIPFFVLAAAASALTLVTQRMSIVPVTAFPVGTRISNVLVAYARYLGKTFWPVDLATPYPLNAPWPWGKVLAAGALLVGLSAWAVWTARKRPYGLVGWLWFLGTMIPVIGLVQVGMQSMADRYTYIPLLGIFWVVVWVIAELITQWRLPSWAVAIAGLMVLGTCAARTRVQLDYWQDGESLFRHAIATTRNNVVAYDGLGWALFNKGQWDGAVFYCLKSLEFRDNYGPALDHLDDALARLEAANAAANRPRAAVERTGLDYASAHNTLGLRLAFNGKLDEAIKHFRKALDYNPDNINARSNLAHALALQGRSEEAIAQCEQVLRRFPHNPQAHFILGLALLKQGRPEEAAAHLRETLQYQPDNAEVQMNLGRALAGLGQRDEAIAHLKEALRLAPNYQDAREQLTKLENPAR